MKNKIMEAKTNKEKFLDLVSQGQSNWHEQSEWRIANREWIKISQQIAMKILTRLDEVDMDLMDIEDELAEKGIVYQFRMGRKMVSGSYNFSIKEITIIENFLNTKLL